ncbi:retinoic acid early-inducible protein 1-epsilon-like [Phodopus roborovskii]|uniref:retinoic acid early-inducible protein 1-epsilon-like n=1 Tax=Phodopus roborovskii TaxID=109678 RepID=UPI0021E3FE19|nr:retinoic acid early-inducible protein 1-epsilon-like [Phodopus roborovskii]
MAKASATRCSLFQTLSLFVLLGYLEATVLAGAHYLKCAFIVKSHPEHGEKGWEVQCSVNGVLLLLYGNPGEEVNASKGCADLYPKLKDIGEELRNQLLDMENEAVLSRDNHNLQATMLSQNTPGQLTHSSWNFTIDNQYSFCFDRFNREKKRWEVTNYNATGIEEKWKNNAELAQDLATLSMGDSHLCLQEVLKDWKETPRPTARTPNITDVASAIQPPPTRQLHNNKKAIAIAVPIAIIHFGIIIWISIYICKNVKGECHLQGGESLNHTCLSLVSRIRGNRSAMGEPPPGNTTSMIVRSPLLDYGHEEIGRSLLLV